MICYSMQVLRRDAVSAKSQLELTQWYCVIWATDIAASSSFSSLAHMTLCSCKAVMEFASVLMWDSRQLKDKLARVGTGDEVICLRDLPMVLGV